MTGKIEIGKIYREMWRYYFITSEGYIGGERIIYYYNLDSPEKREWDYEDTFKKMVAEVCNNP